MSSWLILVPRKGRRAIYKIVHDTTGRRTPHTLHWWVRLTPSVGKARDVTLILRNEYRVPPRVWEIMAAGQLIDPIVETDPTDPPDRRHTPAVSLYRAADYHRRRP